MLLLLLQLLFALLDCCVCICRSLKKQRKLRNPEARAMQQRGVEHKGKMKKKKPKIIPPLGEYATDKTESATL